MKKINFANNLKNLREHHNLTQSKLASILNVTRQSIYSYEQGKATPSLEVLEKMTEIFNCSLDSLIFESTPLNISKFISLNESLDEDYTNFSTLNKLKSIKSQLLNKRDLIDNSLEDIDNSLYILEKARSNDTLENDINDLNNSSSIENNIKSVNNEYKTEIANEFTTCISDTNKSINDTVIYLSKEREQQLLQITKDDILNEDTIDFCDQGRICAGIPTPISECIDYDRPYKIPKHYLCKNSSYSLLTVSGDSMNEIYLDGDHILVETNTYINNGDMVVAIIDGFETTLKEFHKAFNTITLIPHSSNPIFKAKSYPCDSIRIFGKVKYIVDFIDD